MGRIAIDDWTEAGDVWIGAERVDGKFKWTSEDSSCTYTNFEPGEPNFYRQKEFCWHKAVREKKNAFKKWQTSRSPEDLAKYRENKRRAKAAVSQAKNAEMDSLYEKLEQPQAEKFAIRLAKARHRAGLDVRVARAVKNAEGTVLRASAEVKARWEEYFEGLLNEEFPRESVLETEPVEGPIELWTEEEVQSALKNMKVGKAVGPDGVPVEIWKVLEGC
ncbi:unnamed protein product [Nippostrongylus brasiliensis]|uniref:C-type lectin domain-containing protein n=1 Tax=Nippostrongylus brasiliensis TaxID=27835 RepID=A0A158QXC8_NIPBR|nr:unnamed protein product [Nippostrongylus brasiliensis]